MNPIFSKGITALATLGLIVACSNSKKEITKDQETRLNRVESDEAKNKLESEKNNQKAEELAAQVAKLNAQTEEIKALEAKQKADIEAQQAKIKTDEESIATEKEKLAKTQAENDRIAEQAKEIQQKKDEAAALAAGISIKAAQDALNAESKAYNDEILAELANEKDMALTFLVTALVDSERNAIVDSILKNNVSETVKFKKDVVSRGLSASTALVVLNSPGQLQAILDEAEKHPKAQVFPIRVKQAKIRSALTINYNKGGNFSTTIHEGPVFDVGENVSKMDLTNPVTLGNFPVGCGANLNPQCVIRIRDLLDQVVLDDKKSGIALWRIFEEELRVSSENSTNWHDDAVPPTSYTFTRLDPSRVITTITVSHELLVVGPQKTADKFKSTAESLKALSKSDEQLFPAPVSMPISTANFIGLKTKPHVEKATGLRSAVPKE